ncbi:MAG: ABC transporter ATP-binding protein [Clostridiales bacterium]|nr:ABC transporter ATP-binding protein [Clostridiales bacterium]
MGDILRLNNVTKSIGKKKILKGISFNLEQGKVLGIMGPNGNGKTTLLNTIYGFLRETSGEISINGKSKITERKNEISFLQDNVYYKPSMKIKDAANFYNDFFADFNNQKFEEYLNVMKLDRNMKIRDLSKGMNEKLGLSLALSRETSLYMLDEPISGVDPIARDIILDTIIKNINEKASTIITTHYVGELEKIFDDVMFIGDGTIYEYGSADDIREKYNMSIDGAYRKIFGN